jgi:hypothetical protein
MSSFNDGFSCGWRQGHAYSALEAEHRAILHQPPAKNPPELLAPVRVRVLKPFGIGAGRVAEPGTMIDLPRHDAESMAALRRVELV